MDTAYQQKERKVRLLLFNPANDMALAAGTKSYTPPLPIQHMERKMASFPKLWAEEDDEVLTDWRIPYSQLQARHPNKLLVPTPWGWSPSIKYKLLRWGVPEPLLPSDTTLSEWRMLSNRRFAINYLQMLLASSNLQRWNSRLVGENCRYFSRTEDFYRSLQPASSTVQKIVSQPLPPLSESPTYIFKSPWSSSGRGVFITNDFTKARIRLEGYVHHQGGFVVDSYYNKVLDGALEFFVDENGTARFLGYSVFLADYSGHYLNHYVESPSSLRQRLIDALNFPEAEELLNHLIAYHLHTLPLRLGQSYRGPLGIDMLVCEDGGVRKLHPCIEINLRMNMGIVALLQYQRNPLSAPHLLFPTSS